MYIVCNASVPRPNISFVHFATKVLFWIFRRPRTNDYQLFLFQLFLLKRNEIPSRVVKIKPLSISVLIKGLDSILTFDVRKTSSNNSTL